MNIAHFRSCNFIGGPEKQILSHLYHLREYNDIESSLISFDEAGGHALASSANKLSASCCLLPASNLHIVNCCMQLLQFVKDQDIDIVCCHDYKAEFYANLVKPASKFKIVGFSRGATNESRKVNMYMWLDDYLIRKADGIVAVANAQSKKLVGKGVPEKKITVVNNASTSEAINFLESASNSDIRQELAINETDIIIFSAGRLSEEKGHRYLVNAFLKVSKNIGNCHLLLAGDGPLRESLEKRAASAGNAGKVRFLGFRKDISSLFEAADLFVLPSLSEGLPNVLLEAMHFNTPIISSNVGGVPDLISNEISGLITKPGSVDELTAAIEQLCNDKKFRKKLAKNANAVLIEQFDPKAQTNSLVKLYKNVISL